jgi:hypothetical protein
VCRGIYNLVPCPSFDTQVRQPFRAPGKQDIRNAQTRFDRLKKRDEDLETARAASEHQADGGYHRRANTVTFLLAPAAVRAIHRAFQLDQPSQP